MPHTTRKSDKWGEIIARIIRPTLKEHMKLAKKQKTERAKKLVSLIANLLARTTGEILIWENIYNRAISILEHDDVDN